MRNSLMISENMTARVLFIIDDDGRDTDYMNACTVWHIDAVIEHVPYQGYCRAVGEHFDIIIVDDYLARKSGYTLALEIMDRKDAMIFMLGRAMDDVSVVGAFRMGITDYMSAKISPAQLAARCVLTVNHASRQTGTMRYSDGRIFAADLVLDTKNGILEMGERRITLLKMEAVILKVLMENSDTIMTKKEIYEKAWNASYVDGENSVATHISKLRKKMEEDEEAPKYIETRWGIGYRFISCPQKTACC